jgi:hypothetical protein
MAWEPWLKAIVIDSQNTQDTENQNEEQKNEIDISGESNEESNEEQNK